MTTTNYNNNNNVYMNDSATMTILTNDRLVTDGQTHITALA